MINSLQLQNFRSHKNTTLDFHKGINIFTGTSGHGKTNIIRALNWVINNKPSGDAFRSKWGGDTSVTIYIGNKKEWMIDRQRGKENIYALSKLGTRAEFFKSFGQDVPNEIKQLLNFSSLNLQGQFESPFLLAISGGEVARYLNKIVHLDKIDVSLFNINKTLKDEKTDLEYANTELEEVQEKVSTFDWIDEAEGCLVKLESFESSLREKRIKYTKLIEWINKIEGCDIEIEKISQLTKYESEVNGLIKADGELEERESRMGMLDAKITNIELLDRKIEECKAQNEKNQKRFNKLMPRVCPLCGRGG